MKKSHVLGDIFLIPKMHGHIYSREHISITTKMTKKLFKMTQKRKHALKKKKKHQKQKATTAKEKPHQRKHAPQLLQTGLSQ